MLGDWDGEPWISEVWTFNEDGTGHNENSIYLIHGIKTDKIYEDAEGIISDFMVEGNDIRILSKDKLTTGKLK